VRPSGYAFRKYVSKNASYIYTIKPSQEYFRSTMRGGGGDVEEKGKGKERQGCKAEFIKVQLSSEIILWLFPSKGSKDERLNIFNLG